jgi:hypothetical protein
MARVNNQDLLYTGLNMYEIITLVSLKVRQDRLSHMLEDPEDLHQKKNKPIIDALRALQLKG